MRPARRAVAVGSRARRTIATGAEGLYCLASVTEQARLLCLLARLLCLLARLTAATEPTGFLTAVGLDAEDGAAVDPGVRIPDKHALIVVVAAEGDLVRGHFVR